MNAAKKHLEYIPEIVEAFKAQNGKLPNLSLFRHYPARLTEPDRFDRAIEV